MTLKSSPRRKAPMATCQRYEREGAIARIAHAGRKWHFYVTQTHQETQAILRLDALGGVAWARWQIRDLRQPVLSARYELRHMDGSRVKLTCERLKQCWSEDLQVYRIDALILMGGLTLLPWLERKQRPKKACTIFDGNSLRVGTLKISADTCTLDFSSAVFPQEPYHLKVAPESLAVMSNDGTIVPQTQWTLQDTHQGTLRETTTLMRPFRVNVPQAPRPTRPPSFLRVGPGHRLAYHIEGRQSRAPLVLLLGASGPLDMHRGMGATFTETRRRTRQGFSLLSQQLVQGGLRVCRYDRSGMGDSSGSWASVGRVRLLEDAQAVLKHLVKQERGPIQLWGVSEGANLALSLAAQHPKDVARLLLVSPPCDSIDDVIVPKLQKKIEQRILGHQDLARRLDFYQALFTWLREQGPDVELPDKIIEGHALSWWRDHVFHRPSDDAVHVACPTLVLAGGQDADVLPDQAQRLVKRMQAANVPVTFKVYARGNHYLQTPCVKMPGLEYGNPQIFPDSVLRTMLTWLTTPHS